MHRLRRLLPVATAACLLVPATAQACPTSRFGRDAGDLTRLQPGTSPTSLPSGFAIVPYGSAPDLPEVAFGANRGFGDYPGLLLSTGAGSVRTSSGLYYRGPRVLAARVGPSADPAALPVLSIDYFDTAGAVVLHAVAQPQPCPERDGAVTIWRTLASVDPPPQAGSFAVTVATPAGRSFVDGLSLSDVEGADVLRAPRRRPGLRIAVLRREGHRLHVGLVANRLVTGRVRVTVSGGRGRPLVRHLSVTPASRRTPVPFERAFRLPERLRHARLVVRARFLGDRGYGPDRAAASVPAG